MTTVTQHTAQCLANIVASCPPRHRARLSTILVWPTIHGGWTAILSYARYTTVQPGKTPPPDNNGKYPHDTHYPVALDGTEAAVGCSHWLAGCARQNLEFTCHFTEFARRSGFAAWPTRGTGQPPTAQPLTLQQYRE